MLVLFAFDVGTRPRGGCDTATVFGRLRSGLTYANVMATAAMFVALGGGAFALTGIPDGSGVFHGCVSKRTGVLRIVANAGTCRRASRHGTHRDPGELAISFNQQGVPGAHGVPGSQGAPGSQGPPGSNATIDGVDAGGDLTGTYPRPTLAAPEGFHVVGATGEPGFSAGCSTNSVNSHPGFYKDREGVVHLEGAFQCSSAVAAFFLPAGYRPGFAQDFACFNGTDIAVSIGTDGGVSSNGSGCSLNGITFRGQQ